MFITNITHLLNHQGDIPKDMPQEARELASFLTFVIEATTDFDSEAWGFETGIRCNQKDCKGMIESWLILEENHEIYWHCPICGIEGIISEWEGTKWDRS